MKTNILNNVNTITELRPYACAKAIRAKEWSLTCVDCAKKDECACGSRVVELLDRQTKSVKTDRPRRKCDEVRIQQTIARIRACFAPDVKDHIQWLLDHSNLKDRNGACTTILHWIKDYPELAKELNIRERYDACKAYNPVGKKKDSQSKRPFSETKKWDTSGSEEVSIEEFLKENAAVAETTGKALPQPATDEAQNEETRTESVNENQGNVMNDLLLDSFNTKRQELIEELKDAINQMNTIRRNIAALDETARLFGMEMQPTE